MRRQARLFALTEYLRGRRSGITAEALAERFNVTIRTIYRDLDSLRDAALPVQADRGRGGGYALDRNYTLPPVNFTAREAALIVAIGEWAIQMRLLPFADTLSSGLDKVRGALTGSSQRELAKHIESLTFVGVPAAPIPAAIRRAVEQGWFEQCAIEIEYRRNDNVLTKRAVRIDKVIMDRSFTFLDCHDLDKDESRRFRLDRIEHAKVLSKPAKTNLT